jgi:transcriptional regulator with XRE-family HTH domain
LLRQSLGTIQIVMTPTRLRECLESLRWSQRELAAALGCNDRLVRRWAVGAPGYAVPESLGEWLEVLATTHIRHPPPTDWRRPQSDVAKEQDRRRCHE